MMRNQENMRTLKALLRKELILEPAFRRVGIICVPLVCIVVIWAVFSPGSVPLADPQLGGVEQILIPLAMINSFLVPFGFYMNIIQGERRTGSFVLYRTLPIDKGVLFWGHVLSCWLLALILILIPYLLFIFIRLFVGPDSYSFTTDLLGIRFLLFLIMLNWFTSTLAVGLALNINPGMLPLVVTAVTVCIVIFPFVLSKSVAGIDSRHILIRLAQSLGLLPSASLLLALLSALAGGLFFFWFRKKRSFV